MMATHFMTRAFEIVEPGARSEIDNCVGDYTKHMIQDIDAALNALLT